MKTLYLTLSLITLALVSTLAVGALSPSEPPQTVASKKCILTEPVYVLDQQVLPAGEYCIPWI